MSPSAFNPFYEQSTSAYSYIENAKVQEDQINTKGYIPDNNPVTWDEDPNNYPLSRSQTYRNIDNKTVQSPTHYKNIPVGACAVCKDGSYSFSKHRRGTCSRHGGVAKWIKKPYN